MLLLKYKNILNLIFKNFASKLILKDIKQLYLYFFAYKSVLQLTTKLWFLPIRVKKFSVVRSPTTSKLSKEQFEIRLHKANLYLFLENSFSLKLVKRLLFWKEFNSSYFILKVKLYGKKN